jgi:aminopeptidase N
MSSHRLAAALLLVICSIAALSAQVPLSITEGGEPPSRSFDVLHYAINIRIDEVKKSIDGSVAIRLVPFLPALESIRLNAGDMTIRRVTAGGSRELRFDTTRYALTIHLDAPRSPKDTLTVMIEYSCSPKQGMTWAAPDSGYPAKRWQFWSQGEDTTNHFWFPCYDFPNDKATSELTATVNRKLTVLSNGKLMSVKEDKKAGTKTFHFAQSKPHSSYLIMVAGGEYAVLKDKAGSTPLEYYVYPDDTLNARICFSESPKIMTFFNEVTGMTFPWEKYGQIILQDHFGGMENTGATTLTDVGTVYDARARVDDSPVSLIAHEMAHQWWGDLVTCRDFRHMWLNESFASYFDPLYFERWKGRDEFDRIMFDNQNAGIWVDTARGRKPVVSVGSYGENLYPRGAAVLHMLRFVLGDDLFFKGLQHYIRKYQFQPVETNDLVRAIEEATGQNLAWFFDEWIYKAGHPVFRVGYTWSDSAKSVALRVEQTQTQDSLTGIFRTPVNIEITTASGPAEYRVNILSGDTTFTFPAAERPSLVIFDRGNWLLKEVVFKKTREELEYQAQHAGHVIARMRALQALPGLEKSEESIPVFADRMANDPFWAVRREAVNQSGRIKPADSTKRDAVKAALLGALRDARPEVRSAAAAQLGSYRGPEVVAALTAALEDSSYNVMTGALRAIAKADSAHAAPLLARYLDYPSFRNRVANAALGALANVDSVQGIAVAKARAAYGQPAMTRWTAFGILGKYGKGKPDIIAQYLAYLGDKDPGFRTNAARTLGRIGDESVIPALEAVAGDAANPASAAAKQSIETLKHSKEKEGK